LIGGMGVGHGEYFSFIGVFHFSTRRLSSVSHCGKLWQCGGSAFLRQFTVRYCIRTCELRFFSLFFFFCMLSPGVEWESHQY
jgi:hypothetical protein